MVAIPEFEGYEKAESIVGSWFQPIEGLTMRAWCVVSNNIQKL